MWVATVVDRVVDRGVVGQVGPVEDSPAVALVETIMRSARLNSEGEVAEAKLN